MHFSVNNFLTPQKIEVKQSGPNDARIILEPFERGFGHTLGNALRRILLSSMQGCAVTAIRIEGVTHEYGTIEGAHNDVLDIMLNLKGVCIKMLGDRDAVVVRINKKGKGVVTAGDIEHNGSIEIINPDHEIAILNDKGSLYMELEIRIGVGYETIDSRNAQQQQKDSVSANWLQMDAIFSPVRNVNFSVENARVDQRTDLDKLVIDLETNGALDPKEAIKQCASILQYQLAAFVDLQSIEIAKKEKEEKFNPVLFKPIEELDLGSRPHNCLKAMNINLVGDLVQLEEKDMLKAPNLGKKSLDEIRAALANRSLSLGIKIDNWIDLVNSKK